MKYPKDPTVLKVQGENLYTIGGQDYYILFFFFFSFGGIIFGSLLQETFEHDLLGGNNYCNVVICAVLPWKERIFWLQSTVFSLRAMWEWNCCNVTPFLYMILSFRR